MTLVTGVERQEAILGLHHRSGMPGWDAGTPGRSMNKDVHLTVTSFGGPLEEEVAFLRLEFLQDLWAQLAAILNELTVQRS